MDGTALSEGIARAIVGAIVLALLIGAVGGIALWKLGAWLIAHVSVAVR